MMMDVERIAEFGTTVTATGEVCPACGGEESHDFYKVDNVPVHQVRLMPSREAALQCPKGDIRLRFCEGCGFIWNAAFDAGLVTYSEDYESTQTVSPTFNRFHAELARDLVEHYQLQGKSVFEIGCGQGEFLRMICDLGVSHAHGFDPVLRGEGMTHRNVEITKDWYSETYAHLQPDFVCSKMVMEHIPDPARFLGMLRRTIGDRPEVVAFAMMPEIRRILELRAFWDIYYEHCSYFSPGSLARAFRVAGFDPIDLRTGFGAQYNLIGARPGTGRTASLAAEEEPATLAAEVHEFADAVTSLQAAWLDWLQREHLAGRKVVLWGGGSKGVAFLTSLSIRDEVQLVVDVNPRRHGTFIAGTGQPIIVPNALSEHRPDTVLIMSPIYREEIEANLHEIGLSPRLMSIEDLPSTDRAG